MRGEIQSRKLSDERDSEMIPSLSCLDRINKPPGGNPRSLKRNTRSKFLFLCVPTDAAKPRCIPRHKFGIEYVLRPRAFSEIGPAVIQSVSVNMIAPESTAYSYDVSLQRSRTVKGKIVSVGVIATSAWCPNGVAFQGVKSAVIVSIDQSVLLLRQRQTSTRVAINDADNRIVRRSFGRSSAIPAQLRAFSHRAFACGTRGVIPRACRMSGRLVTKRKLGHDLTSNEIVRADRTCIVYHSSTKEFSNG